ncbi:hypothetical protein AAIR29_11815 [Psychrobacter sp. FBL11]|uniref:Lipoprotein n=1 Tax=Psychrobacter saeujeotis TaxID=3143436 RepID=A0ABU9XA57_9GAMM|nr:hypothetical protein [uncultured Psychrobacter sp.]
MKFFKLTALAFASTLALAGCGSDSDNTSTTASNNNGSAVPSKPPVNNTLSELEQAKSIINTAKQFILDNKAIEDAYEDASEILTEQQQARVNLTFEIAEGLHGYMKENSIAKLDAADVALLRDQGDLQEVIDKGLDSDFYWDRFYNDKLQPSDDFLATLDTNGKFKLSGTTLVNSERLEHNYNPLTNVTDTTVTKDSFKITYDKFENSLASNSSTDNFTGRYGFNRLDIGSKADAVVLSSTSQGATVNAQFSDKVLVNDEFDINDVNRAGITLEKAVIKLDNVKLKANDSIIEARDVELGFLDMSRKLADGTLVVRTLPTAIKLTGELLKEKPATDVAISLNAVANETDIKNVIKVTQEGNIEEAAGKFVGVEIVMSLKGNVTKETATSTAIIPLDIQANLKRTARDVVELQGLKASVDGKSLYVTGKTILDTQYNISCKCTQLDITQNNAAIKLKFDVDNKFIIQDPKTGKFADIKVNGKVFGELLQNNGTVSAKFKDNSFIPLGQ